MDRAVANRATASKAIANKATASKELTKTDCFEKEVLEYNLTPKQQAFLVAYANEGANISKACDKALCSRDSFYRWSGSKGKEKADNVFMVCLEKAKEEVTRRRKLDKLEQVIEAEQALRKNVRDGKENSVLFTLKSLDPENYKNDYILGQSFIQNTKNEFNFHNSVINDMSPRELIAEAKRLSDQLQELEGEDKKKIEGEYEVESEQRDTKEES